MHLPLLVALSSAVFCFSSTAHAAPAAASSRLTCTPWSLLDTPAAAGLRYADVRDNVYVGGSCSQVCSGIPQYYLSTNASTGLLYTAGAKFSRAEKYVVEECAWPALGVRTTLTSAKPRPQGYWTPDGWEATLSTFLRIRRAKDPSVCLTVPGLRPNSSAPGTHLGFRPCDNTTASAALTQLFRFNLTTIYDGTPDKNGNPPPPPNNTRAYDFAAFQHFQRPPGQGKRTYFNFVTDGTTFTYVISKPQTRRTSDQLPQFCIDGRKDRDVPYVFCD